jgi:CelD/BcsL family acetyltransferase involved in cellulose biosynthesis
MLSWWRASRTDRTRLRVILVHDRDTLVGVAPFFASITYGLTEMRLLSAGFAHRIGVLSKSGSEERIARPIAAELAGLGPASVVFEGIDDDDPWPGLIARHWPSRRRPLLRTDGAMQAPIIRLDGSYDAWFGRRERRFRKEAGRLRRRLEEQQVDTRIAADEQAIDALLRLHHARWESRGGSNVDEAARAVLLEAASSLSTPDRLLVAMLESPSGPIAAELVLRAGDTAVFWGGGFDPEWSQYGPGMQAMLFTLGSLAEAGVDVADLGGGSHTYKRRLADETTTLVWRTVFPRGWRYPLIRLRLAPKHVRLGLRKAAQRLPPAWQERLKAARVALRPSG